MDNKQLCGLECFADYAVFDFKPLFSCVVGYYRTIGSASRLVRKLGCCAHLLTFEDFISPPQESTN